MRPGGPPGQPPWPYPPRPRNDIQNSAQVSLGSTGPPRRNWGPSHQANFRKPSNPPIPRLPDFDEAMASSKAPPHQSNASSSNQCSTCERLQGELSNTRKRNSDLKNENFELREENKRFKHGKSPSIPSKMGTHTTENEQPSLDSKLTSVDRQLDFLKQIEALEQQKRIVESRAKALQQQRDEEIENHAKKVKSLKDKHAEEVSSLKDKHAEEITTHTEKMKNELQEAITFHTEKMKNELQETMLFSHQDLRAQRLEFHEEIEQLRGDREKLYDLVKYLDEKGVSALNPLWQAVRSPDQFVIASQLDQIVVPKCIADMRQQLEHRDKAWRELKQFHLKELKSYEELVSTYHKSLQNAERNGSYWEEKATALQNILDSRAKCNDVEIRSSYSSDCDAMVIEESESPLPIQNTGTVEHIEFNVPPKAELTDFNRQTKAETMTFNTEDYYKTQAQYMHIFQGGSNKEEPICCDESDELQAGYSAPPPAAAPKPVAAAPAAVPSKPINIDMGEPFLLDIPLPNTDKPIKSIKMKCREVADNTTTQITVEDDCWVCINGLEKTCAMAEKQVCMYLGMVKAEVEIPVSRSGDPMVGLVIGPQGKTIQGIRAQSGAAHVLLPNDGEGRAEGYVTIYGPPADVQKATAVLSKTLGVTERPQEEASNLIEVQQDIPTDKRGNMLTALLIGTGGKNIQWIREESNGCEINISKRGGKTYTLKGTEDQVRAAQKSIRMLFEDSDYEVQFPAETPINAAPENPYANCTVIR